MIRSASTATVAGIFGTSRSGSTWLGAIVGSHPYVAYRFEPFHRLTMVAPVQRLRRRLADGSFTAADLDDAYHALLPAHPVVDKPPFFAKRYAARSSKGRAGLWPLARHSRHASDLFQWLYTPLDQPRIVFKEVNMEAGMLALVLRGGAKAVYLMRHPCAVVWSHALGDERGVMNDVRDQFLEERLTKQCPALLERYREQIPTMNRNEKRALLWRASIEQAMQVAGSDRCLLVLYENLCRDPLGEARRVFEHLDLPLHQTPLQFLDQTTHASRWRRLFHGEMLRSSFYSVFRNPEQAMSHWQQEMPRDEQRKVLALVEDSPAFLYGLEQGHWITP